MAKVITIDGPGGSGKSTVARGVAERLGWALLDSGAVYRGLTCWGRGTGTWDAGSLAALLEDGSVDLSWGRITIHEKDLTKAIPGGYMKVIADCGHFYGFEQPAATADTMTRFLTAFT